MSLENKNNEHIAIKELESERSKLKIKDYTLSVSELSNLYISNELIIRPEYQRLFRWDRYKKSLLIESMLLGLPIPPLFIAENNDGTYELIDGLQRTATILSFLGNLRSTDSNNQKDSFALVSCNALKQLNECTFKNLPDLIKLKFKRYRLTFVIIENDSAMAIKYDMFKRLNTNSEILSHQEMRNCIYRGSLNKVIVEMAKNKQLRENIPLSNSQSDKMQYEEYLLKILAFSKSKILNKFIKNNKIFSDKQYLDYFMEESLSSNELNEKSLSEDFLSYIDVIGKLNKIAKNKIFNKYNKRFSPAHFDMLSNYIIKIITIKHEEVDIKKVYENYTSFVEDKKIIAKLEDISKSSRKRTLERIELFNDYIKKR